MNRTDNYSSSSTMTGKQSSSTSTYGSGSGGTALSFAPYRSKIAPRISSAAAYSSGAGGSMIHRSTIPSIMTRISHNTITSGAGGFGDFMPAMGLGGLSSFAMGSGAIAMRPATSNHKLVTVNFTREKEKKDLSILNDKFATYIERIRFLEVQNRKLRKELEALENNANQGGGTIKSMYDTEINAVQDTIKLTDQERARNDVEYKKAEDELNNLQKTLRDMTDTSGNNRREIDDLRVNIAKNESELNLLIRRANDLKDELILHKDILRKIKNEIIETTKALQFQIFEKNAIDMKKDDLKDQLNSFTKTSQDELTMTNNVAQFEPGVDSSSFFKDELYNAIQEIRQENQEAIEDYRNNLQEKFQITSQSIMMKRKRPTIAPHQRDQIIVYEEQTKNTISLIRRDNETAKMRIVDLENAIRRLQEDIAQETEDRDKMWAEKTNACGSLKERLIQLEKEYDEIVSMKSTLEEEISQYRKLLEGTEGEAGLRQIVEKVEESAQRMQNEKLAAGVSTYSTSALPGTMVTDIRTTRIIGSTSSSTGGYGGVGGYGLGYSSGYNTGLGGGGRSGTYRGASSFDSAMGTGSSYTSGGGYGGGGTGSAAGYTSGYSSSSPHAPLLQRDRLEHTYHQSSDHTGPSPATTGASLSGSADVPSPYHSHNVSSNLARPSYRPSEQQSQSRSYHSESAKYGYNR